MPVLDLDDFLKKNASQKATEPQAPQASASPAAKPAEQSPFAAFTGAGQQAATNAVAGDLLDFRQKTENALSSIGQDFLKLSGRVSALERNTESSQAKTEQLIAIIDRVQPDKISSEISEIRSQLSSIKSAGPAATPAMQDAGSGVRVSGTDVSGAVRRLETEYIEMSSKLRPMEVALEQLKAWADRDKDYFIKTDEAHNKLSELERKIALKSDYPSEQIMSRAQFEKYSKMADMDRQQLRLSVDSLRDTVSQVSASVDRLNSMAAGGHSFYPGAQAAPSGLEFKVLEHDKAIAELRATAGAGASAGGLEKYSQELEKTRAEVSANYEQVKAVEKLLTAQSNKMQAVFSEIQKNLSENKLTSDTISSTHEAVLHDISALKAEHEHGIEDYRRIAAELSQKVEQNARAVSEMHLMINGLQYEATKAGASGIKPMHSELTAPDAGYAHAEQKRLLDETNALAATVAELAKKAEEFQKQAAKIASMEESVLKVEQKVKDSDANNAAMFANITTGFSELKKRLENAPGSSGPAQDPSRVAVIEKGFVDLGEKVNAIEHDNATLFANLSKSVSRLKAQVDSLQSATPLSHEVTATADGKVTFAPAQVAIAQAAPADNTLLLRIDALEKSLSSLKVPSQTPVPTAPVFNANTPIQFNVTPESIGDNLRLFETRLAYLESFKGELDSWKEQSDGMTAKVDSLFSSHAQLVQEVASVISEKQSNAFADDQYTKKQAEEAKELLNELKVQTEMLSSKLAATETNVSTIVGQRFSQLQSQSDRLDADLGALRAALPEKVDMIAAAEERQARALAVVDAKLSQSIEDRFAKASQATSQQALEFAVFRDAMPEKIRLAVAAAESRQADAIGAVDAKVAKLSAESDKLRDFVGKTVAETERNVQDSRTALSEMRSRSEDLAAKISGFSSSQAQFVQDLSGTIEDKFADAQQSIESTAATLRGTITQFEDAQSSVLNNFQSSQAQLLKQFEDRQAQKLAEQDTKVYEFEKKQEKSLSDFKDAQAASTSQFEAQQTKMVSEFESKLSSSVTQFEATQSQMLATFEAKQTEAFSALDSKQAEAIAALDKRQADLAAALEVRESQTTSAIDALRVGVEAQKTASEKTAATLAERMDTIDAFSRSISDLLSTTKTDVSSEFERMRNAQAETAKAVQETDARLSKTVSDGFARSAASIQELSRRSTASIEQLAARSASSTEQLTASISETSKAVASMRSSIEARELGQEQELAAVKAANAALDQKMVGVLAALETVAALSRELDAQRTEVRNTVKELRAAFNAQAVAQVQDAQKQLLAPQSAPDTTDAKSRQEALAANLADLEKAIAEIDSKMPAAPQPPRQQFVRQPQQQARVQQTATAYVPPQPRTMQPASQYASQPQGAPQSGAQQRQEYYAPQPGQQVRREPPRTISSSIRPIQRTAPRQNAPQFGSAPNISAGTDAAQTEADKQAMDLMAELRDKLLGDEAQAPAKKEAKQPDEKETQQ